MRLFLVPVLIGIVTNASGQQAAKAPSAFEDQQLVEPRKAPVVSLSTSRHVWPVPLGSANLSPQTVGYQPTRPVRRNLNFHAAVPSAAMESRDQPAADRIVDYPPGTFPTAPCPPPLEWEPAPMISTALPDQYTVPMQIRTGRSTGHPSIAPSGGPVTDIPLPELEPPRNRVDVAYPIGGIAPEETFSVNNHSYPGLGFLYFDRFLNGGYGATDVDGQRQILIRGAQEAGLVPTPLP